MRLSQQLCVMSWTQHLGNPQWELQDVSGRKNLYQGTLRSISSAGLGLGPPEWFPRIPHMENQELENLWAPEMVSSCVSLFIWPEMVSSCVSLFIWPSPAFQQSLAAAPMASPCPWGDTHLAPTHPSPTPTGIPSSLAFTPSSAPLPLCPLLEHLKSVGDSRILSFLREHGIGLDMRCWISSRRGQSWVWVHVALNPGVWCFLLFNKHGFENGFISV